MYDFIIIGAGFGGLSSAALLSKRGKKVLVIEEKANPGGRASYYEKDGFIWQYGQHSHRLGADGLANRVMERLGDPLDFFEARKGKSKLFYKGKLYERPEGAGGFLTLKALSFRARFRFLKFYLKILKLDSSEWYDKTLQELYRAFNKSDEEVEEFLNFLGFTIMLPDVTIVSAGEVIDFVKRVASAKIAVADVPGGSKQIIDKLQKNIVDSGGKIKFGERVSEILVKDGRACGVVTDRGSCKSENVVFAAPIKNILNVLSKDHFDDDFTDYITGLKNSGGVVIDYISKEPLTDLEGGILGVDEALWVKFQTLFDSTVAPDGYHVCSWGLLTEWGKADDPAAIEATEKRLRQIAAICMPGFQDKVVKERKMVIPVVNANMLIPSQSRPHRPGVKSIHLENLYYIGDTINGEGCSGDIAFSTALMLDDMIK